MSNLLHFLTELVLEPQKQETFIKFPDAVMNAAGLSEVDKVLLKSADKTRIAAPFTGKFPQMFFLGEPNPDPLPDPDPMPPPPPPSPDTPDSED
ncbi:MAG: hypothetical protein F6K31_41730 [Symploca sp. SIO2G7]|nr:hypothetical protein [Symploca sp. SIO2G7]